MVQHIVDWLVQGARGARGAPEVLDQMCRKLLEAGLPIDRAEAFVRTLHPHIVGRSFVWRPGEKVEVREQTYDYLRSPKFLSSPVSEVFQTGEYVRRRLTETIPEKEQAFVAVLAAEGLTEFLAAPLTFLNGEIHAITLATRRPGGFTEEHMAAIRAVIPPLARIAEILALSRTAVNLLNTYVGRNAGERIMAGHIQRGDVEALRAVIWFSDLRGFTAMSGELGPGAVIAVLNELFGCQVPAIEAKGGEVLKFMGDGLLAIFPIVEGGRSASELCDTALDAAREAFAALAEQNARRTKKGDPPLRFGLALHVGEIAYGNIGGAGRLDYTCIGPAVNLAARLEGLTSKLERPMVVSAEFARLSTRPCESVGEFDLKGVAGSQEVFAPRA
jgi:adenylate cyclase